MCTNIQRLATRLYHGKDLPFIFCLDDTMVYHGVVEMSFNSSYIDIITYQAYPEDIVLQLSRNTEVFASEL